MAYTTEMWEKISKLQSESRLALSEGDRKRFIKIMNKLISFVESQNLPSHTYRLRKEYLSSTQPFDLTKIIPILEEALEHYKKQNDILLQIKTLIDLSSAIFYHSSKHTDAVSCLDQADKLIESLTPNHIIELAGKYPSFDANFIATQLASRSGEIEKLRKLISETNH